MAWTAVLFAMLLMPVLPSIVPALPVLCRPVPVAYSAPRPERNNHRPVLLSIQRST